MPDVKTYDPSQGSLIIGGAIVGSWRTVAVVKDEDGFSFDSDTNSGEATRTKNSSKLGTITVTLPQASADNAGLSAHEAAGSLIACVFKDNSGLSLHVMPLGTIVKGADAEYAKEAGDREWSIRGNLDVHLNAGNS